MVEVKKELVVKGGLKLKKDPGVFKKKKDKKREEREAEAVAAASAQATTSSTTRKTPAEIAFMKRQEATAYNRLYKKAAISHREKVEQFNEKMNTLTEFNDIPKVSWTK